MPHKQLQPEDIETIRGMWRRGVCNLDIADATGFPIGLVRRVVTGRNMPNQPDYVPTPEEIREACEEIQAEWSPDTEEKRRIIKNSSFDFGTPHRRYKDAA